MPAPRRYCAGASILCPRPLSWRRLDLPGSLATPLPNMPCSSTPADRSRQAFTTPSILPSVRFTTSAPLLGPFRGSITRPVRSLSTLRSSDHSDNTTQDSLPADGHSWRDRIFTCQVASGGFDSVLSAHIVSSSSRLSWRTKRRANERHVVGCSEELDAQCRINTPELRIG